MGNVQSDDAAWCSSCSKSHDEQEPSPPSLCPASYAEPRADPTELLCHQHYAEPRADPTELLRGLAAAVEGERAPPDAKARESDCVGDRAAPTPPRRPRNPRLSRQAPPPPTAPQSEQASLSDDLADVFPQARARAARRHLSGAASKSSSDLSMQIALKVWTFAAG